MYAQSAASGKSYPRVFITLAGTGTRNGFYITLEDVRITSVRQYTNPDPASPRMVLEDVTFSYGKVTWNYPKVTRGWDILANRPTLAAADGVAETTA